MPVNIKNVLELLQSKIDAVDNSTSIYDLEYLFKAAKKAAGSVIHEFDSDGALPDVNDTNIRIAFIRNRGVVAYNNGKWDYAVGEEVPDLYAVIGSALGYTMGGYIPGNSNVIDAFSFTSDGNATDVGDLTIARYDLSGGKSTTHGYALQGYPSPTGIVDKFSFASGGNAISAATTRYNYGSADAQNFENIFLIGGTVVNNGIDKFALATETNTTAVASLVQIGYDMAGHSSITHGYSSGGLSPSTINVIQKFPFAITSGSSTDVGDLVSVKYSGAGVSSQTYGYWAGGSPTADMLQKFPFATDTNASNVGSLATQGGSTYVSGNQSGENGYATGFYAPPSAKYDQIQKWPFATDTNASAIGFLSASHFHAASTSN